MNQAKQEQQMESIDDQTLATTYKVIPKLRRSHPSYPKIDEEKWFSSVRIIESAIRDLKHLMNQPNHNITRDEAKKLEDLKQHATHLCMVRAASRGRIHLREKMLKEARLLQLKQIELFSEEYFRMLEIPSSSVPELKKLEVA
jgi:hypothetical protein